MSKARGITLQRDDTVINVNDGSGLKRLTNDPAYDNGPTWQPAY